MFLKTELIKLTGDITKGGIAKANWLEIVVSEAISNIVSKSYLMNDPSFQNKVHYNKRLVSVNAVDFYFGHEPITDVESQELLRLNYHLTESIERNLETFFNIHNKNGRGLNYNIQAVLINDFHLLLSFDVYRGDL